MTKEYVLKLVGQHRAALLKTNGPIITAGEMADKGMSWGERRTQVVRQELIEALGTTLDYYRENYEPPPPEEREST